MERECRIHLWMLQDKLIAAQRECEERYLQSDTPDYRALYFRLFAQTEQVRRAMEELLKE